MTLWPPRRWVLSTSAFCIIFLDLSSAWERADRHTLRASEQLSMLDVSDPFGPRPGLREATPMSGFSLLRLLTFLPFSSLRVATLLLPRESFYVRRFFSAAFSVCVLGGGTS